MQALSGEQTISPVTLPPKETQDLRSLFSTYRLYKKQQVQTKNRIHSPVKEQLYGYTQKEIFDRKSRVKIRGLGERAMKFQVNRLMDRLEREEEDETALKDQIQAEPFMAQIEILTSMKGVSVFIAIAIIADIIDVSRFKNSKSFTSYLRPAPRVAASNTSTTIREINKKGRKLPATLLTQSLIHVLAASPKLRRRVFAEIYQMLKKGNITMAETLQITRER